MFTRRVDGEYKFVFTHSVLVCGGGWGGRGNQSAQCFMVLPRVVPRSTSRQTRGQTIRPTREGMHAGRDVPEEGHTIISTDVDPPPTRPNPFKFLENRDRTYSEGTSREKKSHPSGKIPMYMLCLVLILIFHRP